MLIKQKKHNLSYRVLVNMKQASLDTVCTEVCTTDWFIWFLVTSPSVFFEPYLYNRVYQDVVTPPAESRMFSTFDPCFLWQP